MPASAVAMRTPAMGGRSGTVLGARGETGCDMERGNNISSPSMGEVERSAGEPDEVAEPPLHMSRVPPHPVARDSASPATGEAYFTASGPRQPGRQASSR